MYYQKYEDYMNGKIPADNPIVTKPIQPQMPVRPQTQVPVQPQTLVRPPVQPSIPMQPQVPVQPSVPVRPQSPAQNNVPMQTPTPMKPPVHTPTMTIEKCLYNQESECGTTNNTYNINKNTDCCSKPVCNEDMSRLYPDVFKIIVPGINSVIGNYLSSPITSDVVSAITEEVYQLVADGVLDKLEGGGEITIQRNRQPYRPQHHAHRRKNPLLSDLIRITLVNLLLGGKNPYHGHGPFYRTSLPFPEDM